MAKKKKARGLSAVSATESHNPFEERWNRQARRTAPKKPFKQKGSGPVYFASSELPSGISNRNVFEDQRIGEKRSDLSEQDKYLARLQRERSRSSRKRMRYNLSDTFDDDGEAPGFDTDAKPSRSSRFDGAEQSKRDKYSILQKEEEPDFILSDVDGSENYSGFSDEDVPVNRKDLSDSENGNGLETATFSKDEHKHRTHREVMHEVMNRSKSFKTQRQHDKAIDEGKREILDRELQQVRSLLAASSAQREEKSDNDEKYSKLPDDASTPSKSADFNYEAVFRELASEKRAHAADRLKTEEEKAEEERNRLEELEIIRRRRMQGILDSDDDEDGDDDSKEVFNSSDLRRLSGDEADLDSFSEVRKETTNPEKEKPRTEKRSKGNFDNEESIPYFFEQCPSNLEELEELLMCAVVNLRGVIVERMLKCFSASLNPSVNVPKLQTLLALLLARIDNLSETCTASLQEAAAEIDLLLAHVFALSSNNPSVLIQWARVHLSDAYHFLTRGGDEPLSKSWNPTVLLRLRCISRLFPGSDVRHTISTPLQILLSASLASSRLKSEPDFALACFICEIALESTASTSRASGEIISFLSTSIKLFSDRTSVSSFRLRQCGFCPDCHAEQITFSPLTLADCVEASQHCHREACIHSTSRIFLALLGLMRAAVFRGRLPAADLGLIPIVDALPKDSEISSKVLSFISDQLGNEKRSRVALRLYTENAVVAPKPVNPKFTAVNGVYRKQPKRNPQQQSIADMTKSANRIRKALNKEQRGYARELRKEAMVAAQIKNDLDNAKQAYAEEKSKELLVFLEKQQATWKQQAKKQRLLSGKKW